MPSNRAEPTYHPLEAGEVYKARCPVIMLGECDEQGRTLLRAYCTECRPIPGDSYTEWCTSQHHDAEVVRIWASLHLLEQHWCPVEGKR